MPSLANRHTKVPLGIVIRRTTGVTRWAKHVWRAVAVLPGAGPANWKELRRDGDAVEYHAATVSMDLHAADAEAYLHGLSTQVPCVYVVMRNGESEAPLDVLLATASPYEGQDYADTGEELVEKVPMPEGLVALVRDFVAEHHEEETFVKRKRDRVKVEQVQDGIGDSRIRQTADVFRAPVRREDLH
ncbi:MAG: DUF3305 domain-containing protein [Aliishimia sp.]